MSKENDLFPNQEEYLLFHPSQLLSQSPSIFSDTDSEGDVSIIPSTPKVNMQGGKIHLPSGKNLLNDNNIIILFSYPCLHRTPLRCSLPNILHLHFRRSQEVLN